MIERLRWNEVTGCGSLVNLGRGAETTAQLSERLASITNLRPRSTFLLIGINDINEGMAAQQVADNYRRIVASLVRSGTQLYIIATLPVGKIRVPLNAEIATLDKAIVDIARTHDLIVIDPRQELVDEDGSLREDFTTDGIHLNGAGYRILRDAVAPHVTKECGGSWSARVVNVTAPKSKWARARNVDFKQAQPNF